MIARGWRARSRLGSESAMRLTLGSSGCSPPKRHAPRWVAFIPAQPLSVRLPTSHNQCAEELDGRLILVNTGTCALLGKEPAQLLGNRDRDFYPRDIAERIEAVDRQVLRTGSAVVLEQ